MAEGSNQTLLRAVVVSNSEADNWEKAKTEWELMTIYDQENHCECNHSIMENCVIRNKNNQNELTVGNVCINHFKEPHLEVPPACRKSLTNLHKNPNASANKELVQLAVRLLILTSAEGAKYIDITSGQGSRVHFKPGHPSFKQWMVDLRDKINSLIRLGFSSERPRCQCGQFAKPRQNSWQKTYFYSCFYGQYIGDKWSARCDFTKSASASRARRLS